MTALIEAAGLGLTIGGRRILRDVAIAVTPGEIVTLVGPNGSGKTTLLRLLIGAQQPSAGALRRSPGLRVGYVPQRLSIDATLPMTVDRFLGLGGGDRAARAAALARTGVPGLGARQMADLSGGQFQRALLARALVRRPALLALDEPTQGLDQPGVAAFYRLIAELRTRLRGADGQPRPPCGDGRLRPGDLPQRPHLLRGRAHRGRQLSRLSRAVRRGARGRLRALRPQP
jgi:zinc transport system ATP-binding protein